MDRTPEGLTFEPVRHAYAIDGIAVPGVSKILRTTGISAFPVDKIPVHLLEASRFRGRAVHAAIEKLERVYWQMEDTPDVAKPYLEQYENFLDDTRWRPQYFEVRIVSRVHRFAGRLDQVGWLDHTRTMLDVKTGALDAGGLEAARYQVGAYSLAWNEENQQEQVRKGLIVLLSKTNYRIKEVDLKEYIPKFIGAVRCYYEIQAEEAQDERSGAASTSS